MSYTIMGITGQVGGAAARSLLGTGKEVRALVRNPAKAEAWRWRGVELVTADAGDAPAMGEAMRDTDGAFVMLPPNFAPSSDFREARTMARALATAVVEAQPRKVVVLSSIGAHHDHGLGLVSQLFILEQALAALPMPVAFLRPGWFMENALWDVAPARETGIVSSFLHPLTATFPMIAVDDIGRVIAELLQAKWSGRRIVELEGPRRYSPNDLAVAFEAALGRRVAPMLVPREKWESLFREQGTADPTPRIDMLDGFNSGWIEFQGPPATHVKGRIELATVIETLVERG